jgi:hypothetical protein
VDRQKTNHDYVCVKSRLHKKLKVFVDQELPLILEKGYLSDIAEFRNTSKALVAQPGCYYYIVKKSLGRDSSPRPLPVCKSLRLMRRPYQGNALPG